MLARVYVTNHPSFDRDFPEKFDWESVYHDALSVVARKIAIHIECNLKTADRILVPGLRLALAVVATKATVSIAS